MSTARIDFLVATAEGLRSVQFDPDENCVAQWVDQFHIDPDVDPDAAASSVEGHLRDSHDEITDSLVAAFPRVPGTVRDPELRSTSRPTPGDLDELTASGAGVFVLSQMVLPDDHPFDPRDHETRDRAVELHHGIANAIRSVVRHA